MKTLLTATAVVALLVCTTSSAQACGGYGGPDQTVLKAIGSDQLSASAAYANLLGQGQSGLRRAERTQRTLRTQIFYIGKAVDARLDLLKRDFSKLNRQQRRGSLDSIEQLQWQAIGLADQRAKIEWLIHRLKMDSQLAGMFIPR